MSDNNKTFTEVLLVEDNEGDVLLTKAAFGKNKIDANIHVAYNGIEALTYLEHAFENKSNSQTLPDLILLDINMPKMNGKEFLDKAKNDKRFHTIPILILSSSEAKKDIVECYEKHANAYLIKPHSFDQLKDLIGNINSFWCKNVALPTL